MSGLCESTFPKQINTSGFLEVGVSVANLSLLVALYIAGVDGAILLPTICADYRTSNM